MSHLLSHDCQDVKMLRCSGIKELCPFQTPCKQGNLETFSHACVHDIYQWWKCLVFHHMIVEMLSFNMNVFNLCPIYCHMIVKMLRCSRIKELCPSQTPCKQGNISIRICSTYSCIKGGDLDEKLSYQGFSSDLWPYAHLFWQSWWSGTHKRWQISCMHKTYQYTISFYLMYDWRR